MNIKELIKYTQKPVLFERGTANMWDDPHISKYMLEAHLNPDWDAASRRTEVIERTVAWIQDSYLKKPSVILDMGCGPGLYAERLTRLGHNVTGIDFSKRSITYAKASAEKNNLDIAYFYKNYLELDDKEKYDAIILIYCDFGALTNEERDILLGKVYHALKPGGIFIFDVFTHSFLEEKPLKKDWQMELEGFWSGEEHIVLSEVFQYPEDKVFLDQYIVIKESGTFEIYRTFDHYYSEKDLLKLLSNFRFEELSFKYDLVQESNFTPDGVVFVTAKKTAELLPDDSGR